MARIRYQPATKTKGFQPIQLTTAGISRMREETNRVVQGMEKNLAAEQRQRQENLQAMQDNAAYTERITKENRAIEVQNLKNEELSIAQTAQRDQQQAQYNADAAQTILSSLSDFSTTIAKESARRTAEQLKDQTNLAAAVDTSSILPEIIEAYKQGEASLLKGGMINTTELMAEGAQNGEPLSKTLEKIAAEAGLGAVGRKALLNRLYGEVHGTFVSNAFTDTEKKYEINGVKFSGIEAARDPEKTAIVQSDINTKLVDFFRSSYGITESLYFTDGKTTAQKRDAIIRDRSEVNKQKFEKEIILQKAADIALGGTTNNYTAAYELAKTIGGYTEGHQFLTNQIGFAETDAQVEAIGNIITDDGRLYKDRFPNKFKPAVQARQDRIAQRNRENLRVRADQYRALEEANFDYLKSEIDKNPHSAYRDIEEAAAEAGTTPSARIKLAHKSALKNLANQESALLDSKILSRSLDSTFINALEDDKNRKRAIEAFKQLQSQELGGELGVGIVSGFNQTAKQQTKINAPMGTQQTYLFEARMLNEYKAHLKKHGDPLAANQYVQDLITAGNNDDKNSPFYKENRGTSMYYPNLETPSKDKATQRLNINKAVLENGIGVVDMPEALATTQEMDASYLSFSRNNVGQYPAGILQAAELTGNTPSEIFNAHRKANNKKYGTNKPLITPSLITDAIDQANPRIRKLLTSGNEMQVRKGAMEMIGTTSSALRPTFRNTPLQTFAPQVSSVTFDTGQPGIDVFFEDHNFPAVLPGMVKDIGYQVNANGSGYGHYLVIESIDPATGEPVDVLYGHLPSKPTQSRGQSIALGEIIGKQGGTGSVQSYDGTIASIDFLAPAPPGSGSMTPYRHYDSLRRSIASQLQ